MIKKINKLIIIGTGETADIAYEYFTHDSDYDVIAFSVNEKYIKTGNHHGFMIVPFESLEKVFNPEECKVYVAISYTQLNRSRKMMYEQVKSKGFSCANYISSKAFVWHNVEIGENCMIMENNVIQHKVKIGNNVILWSGNHIGHQTIIKDHIYISSHVVISGFCEIGESCFLGVNSSFNDNIKVQEDVIIGNGTIVTKNLDKGKVYVGNPAKALEKITSYNAFKVPEEMR